MTNKLTELQQKVFDVLDEKPNFDIPLAVLYDVAYGDSHNHSGVTTSRDMQQKMGPLFSRINGKLKRGRIIPGQLKRTYRLDTNRKA